MTSLNENAWKAFEAAIDSAGSIGMLPETRPCGTHLLDAGVTASGGLEAGLVMARIGMSGMGTVALEMETVAGLPWPCVTVHSDLPLEACFLSQAAHWPVDIGSYKAMGSGPACLLNRELGIEAAFGFQEVSDRAVLVLEAPSPPDDEACRVLAGKCSVEPDRLALIVAPTSSLAGSVQIAARSLETGLHKLHHLGLDLHRVVSGMGRCPVAPPSGSDIDALGNTNDMVFFGSRVWMTLRGIPDGDLESLVGRIPASSSPGYGEPFLQTLQQAGGFYAIDPGLFAPAEVTLINADSGRVFHAGSIDQARLARVLNV